MFPASDQTEAINIDVFINLTDDMINEADEVFVVRLELVDALDPNRVDLDARDASLCRIGDNDRMLETVTWYNILKSPSAKQLGSCFVLFFQYSIFIGLEFASYTYI